MVLSTEMNEAFQSLFFGDGAILGFSVILIITVIVVAKGKGLGAIMLIPQVILAFQYNTQATDTNGLYWYFIGSLFTMIITGLSIFYTIKD